MTPSNDITAFRSVLRQSKNIVAVAGAGLSAASGIPTFRGAGGLWRSYDAMSLATPGAFAANPSNVWQFYHYRRMKAAQASPNAAHLALARLSIPEELYALAPSATFTFVTQNVDGLSTQAYKQLRPSGSASTTPIFEMHGRLFDTICTSCMHREHNTQNPICPALTGTEHIVEKHESKEIPLADLPRCKQPGCGGLLRPGVVWFEEIPWYMEEIDEVVGKADLALVVGTSSTVYPAAAYAHEIAENGGKVAVFNLERSEGDEDADFLFLGPCEQTLANILFGTENK